jgi:hypothetical protein
VNRPGRALSAPLARVYTAYGGVFVVISLVWARVVDGFAPDRFDILGAAVWLVGVAVIMYAPRQGMARDVTISPRSRVEDAAGHRE